MATIPLIDCSEIKSGYSGVKHDSVSQAIRYGNHHEWFLWMDTIHSPYLNMAIDEQNFYECSKLKSPLVRFYGWDRPAISIGYFQCYDSGIPSEFSVVRRPTGGGIVFHGDDITYSITTPSTHWLYKINRRESYRIISDIITKSLLQRDIRSSLSDRKTPSYSLAEKRRQMCFNNPVKFDVLVNDKKVAGAAQKRNQHGLLHQGSIRLNEDKNFDREQLKSCLIAEFQHLFACKMSSFEPRAEFSNRADILARKKYRSPKWNKKN